ncbi:cytochrome P450 6j1-like [Periplaneta americana]|uniref:cytochrome P450 6j1-like n=1 Tax=Periplaneta americana TaxID=6978 RepID=UPI0037E868BF
MRATSPAHKRRRRTFYADKSTLVAVLQRRLNTADEAVQSVTAMRTRWRSSRVVATLNDMDDEMLIAQAFQIFIAGFETSSSTATFALYQLAFHPEIQERLREEMLDNLTKHNQEVTYDGIKEMTYLHMVISETLRMYPVIAFLDRVCQQDYQLPDPLREGSVTLPARTSVYIPLLGIHRNPEYYPDPEKFDPERFTEEGKQLRPKYSYLPFGDGPRNCLGKLFGLLQVKTALIHILSKYVVTPCKDTPRNLVYDQKSFVLQTRDDIPLVFKRFGH